MALAPKRQSKRLGRVVLGASVNRDTADLIEAAADLIGESVSAFIGVAAVKRAERELAKAERDKAA